MKTENYGFWNKLNTIDLSDAFRRHAKFDDERVAAKLVELARATAVLLTHYRGEEGPRFPENKRVVDGVRNHISLMVGIAWGAGIDEIVLPVSGDPSSVLAQVVREQIIGDIKYPIKVSLQEGVYETDLSYLGRIDPKIHTALDEGVRGMMNISPQLVYTW